MYQVSIKNIIFDINHLRMIKKKKDFISMFEHLYFCALVLDHMIYTNEKKNIKKKHPKNIMHKKKMKLASP